MGAKAVVRSDWLSLKLSSVKLTRMKKVPSCRSVECWSDWNMFPPCSKINWETAATIPGWSGHEINSVIIWSPVLCSVCAGTSYFPLPRMQILRSVACPDPAEDLHEQMEHQEAWGAVKWLCISISLCLSPTTAPFLLVRNETEQVTSDLPT